MKRFLILGVFALLVLALASCGGYGPASPSPAPPAAPLPGAPAGSVYQVKIKGFAFNPSTITIKKGESINWTNEDGPAHTATGAGFDSKILATGKSYSHTFNDAGTFDYRCTIHPSMKGQVVVLP